MLFLLLFCSPVLRAEGAASAALPDDGERPSLEALVCGIFGVSGVEDAGEEMVEEVRRFMNHPFRINEASPDAVRRSGLFTPYQAAALTDYREKTGGQVLSALELGQIDGFNPEMAAFYAFLLDFSPAGTAGQGGRGHRLYLRAGSTSSLAPFSPDIRTSMRYAYGDGTGWCVRAGGSWPASQASWPLDGTLHLSRSGRRLAFYLGDMNLRFGQGLVIWSGMSLSGLPSTALIMKNACGIGVPSSYTGGTSVCGVGLSASWNSWTFSGALGCPGLRSGDYSLLPVLNLNWYGRRSRAGHTLALNIPGQIVSSFDFAICLHGMDFFGELACDWKSLIPAAFFGFISPVGECLHLAFAGRYYPAGFKPLAAASLCSISKCSNEAGGNFVLDFKSQNRKHALEWSMDAAWHPEDRQNIRSGDWQVRGRLDYRRTSSVWSFAARYALKLRGNSRQEESAYAAFKPRQEIRLDAGIRESTWAFTFRTHFQYSEAFSFLTYAEGAWTPGHCSLYLRQGFFLADHWADRIYAYERDLPQSFSVPAYYGRGCWTAFYARAALSGWCQLALKASYICWPWNIKKKPGKAGLKLLLYFRF